MKTRFSFTCALTLLGILLLSPRPGQAVTRTEIMDNAVPYVEVYWYCSPDNIEHPEYTMGGCQPCDFSVGWYYGEAYSYGGEDTYTEFAARILAGDGAGSHYCHYDYWGGTPEWATGIDCSAYVSECWEISRQSTYTLPYWSTAILHSRLLPGDILNVPYSHVRLYHERAGDGRPIVYEASGSAAKVVHRVVDWGSYQPRVKHELYVPPPLVHAQNMGDQIRLSWATTPGVTQYKYFHGLDGATFQDSATTPDTSVTYTGLDPGIPHYFKVAFQETTDAEAESEVLAAKSAAKTVSLLVVNGFDRLSEGNTFDFIREHAEAIFNTGYAFDACSNELVEMGIVNLNDYAAVIWILGEESTENETFGEQEQLEVQTYLENGGKLFVTGSEIGWDLVQEGNEQNDWDNGSPNDTPFYQDYLKATYVGDDAGAYTVSGVGGTIFDGLSGITFDDGSHGTYDVDYPDRIDSRDGSTVNLTYNGTSYKAGVQYEGLFGSGTVPGKLVYLGFPFETIYPSSSRDSVMARVLEFFALPSDTVLQVIVDNDDPGCQAVGDWQVSTWGSNYGPNKLYNSDQGTGTEHVTWRTPLPVPGTYALYFWVNDGGYADTARYIVYDLDGPTQTMSSQYNVGDGWHHLGQYLFGDSATVRVTDQWSGDGTAVVADAVRLVCLGADDTPPGAVQDLSATLAGQDVNLGWSAVTADTAGAKEGISHYVVYRSQDPDFGAQPSDSLARVAGTGYTDPGAAGTPGANYYYVVRAVDYAGYKSEPSDTVGEFDRGLISSK
jgi:hypothetical protein